MRPRAERGRRAARPGRTGWSTPSSGAGAGTP
jgi:hypothetical protein